MPAKDLDVEKVEHDLATLAHHKAGFDRPETLVERLNVVLALDAVTEVVGQLQDSRTARVVALRTVLRQCVGRMTSEATRVMTSLYFFLYTEDELEQRGLSPQLAHAPLGERRAAIASILKTTPSAFRNGDEHRLSPLLAGELLCYETEIRRIAADPDLVTDPDQQGHPSVMTARGATQAVSRALAHLYRDEHQLLSLASLVVPDRVIYYDAFVELSLHDAVNDPERYVYRLALTFTTALSEYVVGYVARSHLTDTLLVGAKRLTDVYSFSTETARDECVAGVTGSLDVVTLVTSRGGQTLHKPLRVEPVPLDEYESYLDDEYERYGEDIKLLRAALPDSEKTVRLKVIQEFSAHKSDHFCYWVADRPIYLRQLRVDTREFTPPGSGRGGRVTLQPFMMATNAEIALHIDGKMSEETENWLIRGQGFTVVW
jgi:hypothetical protein